MALNQSQWYAKITKWVPGWMFKKKILSPAVFQAIAAVFAQIQKDTDDAQTSTFITESAAPVLDLHGDERTIPRLTGELDASYAPRVQSGLFVGVGQQLLESVIDPILFSGDAFMIENEQYGFYDDPDVSMTPGYPYYDDYWTRWLDHQKWYNWWTLIIPDQTGAPSITLIQQAIIAVIETNKAFGTTYDVLDETGSGITIGSEAGQDLDTEGGSGIIV